MKVIEILKLGRKMMEMLQESCIKISDVRYIDLFDEYERMISNGDKKSYVVAFLSDKYGVSERQIYYLLKKFGENCKDNAV